MSGPSGRLAHLDLGSRDVDAALRHYGETLGAEVAWNHAAFGARVVGAASARRLLLLVTGHRGHEMWRPA